MGITLLTGTLGVAGAGCEDASLEISHTKTEAGRVTYQGTVPAEQDADKLAAQCEAGVQAVDRGEPCEAKMIAARGACRDAMMVWGNKTLASDAGTIDDVRRFAEKHGKISNACPEKTSR